MITDTIEYTKALGGPIDGQLIKSDLVHLVPLDGYSNIYYEYWYETVFNENKKDYENAYIYKGILLK